MGGGGADCTGGGGAVCTGGGVAELMDVPQAAQNLASGFSSAPQFGQNFIRVLFCG